MLWFFLSGDKPPIHMNFSNKTSNQFEFIFRLKFIHYELARDLTFICNEFRNKSASAKLWIFAYCVCLQGNGQLIQLKCPQSILIVLLKPNSISFESVIIKMDYKEHKQKFEKTKKNRMKMQPEKTGQLMRIMKWILRYVLIVTIWLCRPAKRPEIAGLIYQARPKCAAISGKQLLFRASLKNRNWLLQGAVKVQFRFFDDSILISCFFRNSFLFSPIHFTHSKNAQSVEWRASRYSGCFISFPFIFYVASYIIY